MNIKEYIESGVLELYVAGTLSSEEKKVVESYAMQYPEVREEIRSIEKAFETYAMTHAKTPSDQVLSKILTELNIDGNEKEESEKVIKLKHSVTKTLPIIKYLAYAATALLFISGGLNIYYYNKYQDTQSQLVALQGDKEMLANQRELLQASYDQIAAEMNIMKNPANIAVTMKGLPIEPTAIATVYWNKSTGDVHLNINNLPVPPQGKQYQLWALKDGKPIDAGIFDMKTQLQTMKNIIAADAFAVSLEPAGGSVSPTMELIYLLGNV
ncbi:MAG: anti-sigma factor domain-containing protein [Chitinophagales bacterium]